MDILLDTVIDNLKLFPFLFITYLFLEYLEHKTSDKTEQYIRKAGAAGPLIGALCGTVPQCGFSVVASNLYAARVIGLGTLLAIYLSTSDEMLPILISNAVSPTVITEILAYKAACGIIFGYLIGYSWNKCHAREQINIEQLCENENCHCEEGIIRPALHHSVRITLFIFIITLIFNFAVSYVDARTFTAYLQIPLIGEMLSAGIGLIPNCSASVILTQLYLDNYISISTLISGSLVNCGVGLLVLFRVNRRLNENLSILAILYFCGVLGGLLSHFVF